MKWGKSFLAFDVEIVYLVFELLLMEGLHLQANILFIIYTLIVILSELKSFDLTLFYGNVNRRETVVVYEVEVHPESYQLQGK